MPKHTYDKYYGALTIYPFYFSWLGFLLMPVMLFVKDRETLKKINNVCDIFVYSHVSIILLLCFMSFNLILLPIAYFKTIAHKAVLF